MRYSQFAEDMLIALYQESETAVEEIRFKDLVAWYGLSDNERWLNRLSEEWKSNRYAEVQSFISGPLEWYVEISGAGMRYIEDRYGDKTGVGTVLHRIATVDDNPSIGEAGPISSSTWTGLPSDFELTEKRREKLVVLLTTVESDLDKIGVGNSEKAMARAYIVAAKALADAPVPPVDLIWVMIGRANALSGIASLLVSVVALFSAAH